jgi:hypothetical protein
LSRLVSHLSELIRVSNITKFWGIVDNCRNTVDNPAVVRASWEMGRNKIRPKTLAKQFS